MLLQQKGRRRPLEPSRKLFLYGKGQSYQPALPLQITQGHSRESASQLQAQLEMKKELEPHLIITGLGTIMTKPVWPGS